MPVPRELIGLAIARLKAGQVSCEKPQQEFGGLGEGIPCAICGAAISAREMEIEAVYPKLGERHFHVACMNALRTVCTDLADTGHATGRPGGPFGPIAQ